MDTHVKVLKNTSITLSHPDLQISSVNNAQLFYSGPITHLPNLGLKDMDSHSAPPDGFPLDQLTPELQRMVFAAVDVGDVPNLRLTCKSLGEAGLEYLLPEVELLFTLKSFDRLRPVSEHPALSRHVKSLVYSVDSPNERFDHVYWSSLLRSSYVQLPAWAHHARYDAHPLPYASDREVRAWRRKEKKKKPPIPTQR
ncbi:MAG: hypothetical protein Q9184_005929 [Pyrenodesmia sp. 2 TL-2023]